jgi:hypothetical protein
MRLRSRVLFIVLTLALVSVFTVGTVGLVSAVARAGMPAIAATSSGELDAAIGLFERFNPDLLEPNRPIEIGRRRIEPGFAPLRFSHEGSFSKLYTHLTGTLLFGEMSELEMYLATPPTATTTFSLPAHEALMGPVAFDMERLVNGVAFIEGDVSRQTDLLVRPVARGFSVYVQLRSPAAPERFTIRDKVECDPGSELIRRLAPGTFAIEYPIQERYEEECEPYSRSRIPAHRSIEPADTSANYEYETRLLRAASAQARRDDASVLAVVSATSARDATGRVVPTEMAWRYQEEPVLRVHLRSGHYSYPVLAHIEFIAKAR